MDQLSRDKVDLSALEHYSKRVSGLFEGVAGNLADEVAALTGQLRAEVAAVAKETAAAREKDLVRQGLWAGVMGPWRPCVDGKRYSTRFHVRLGTAVYIRGMTSVAGAARAGQRRDAGHAAAGGGGQGGHRVHAGERSQNGEGGGLDSSGAGPEYVRLLECSVREGCSRQSQHETGDAKPQKRVRPLCYLLSMQCARGGHALSLQETLSSTPRVVEETRSLARQAVSDVDQLHKAVAGASLKSAPLSVLRHA